jgi:hypothetical protein
MVLNVVIWGQNLINRFDILFPLHMICPAGGNLLLNQSTLWGAAIVSAATAVSPLIINQNSEDNRRFLLFWLIMSKQGLPLKIKDYLRHWYFFL